MGDHDAELDGAAHRAVGELRRVERTLEQTVGNVSDRHLAGRVRDCADRIRVVADALAAELDRPEPHVGWLRRCLGLGAFALVTTASQLLMDDMSDRVDLIDVAGALAAGVPDAIMDGADIAQAMTAYQSELERFDERIEGGSDGGKWNEGLWNDGTWAGKSASDEESGP